MVTRMTAGNHYTCHLDEILEPMGTEIRVVQLPCLTYLPKATLLHALTIHHYLSLLVTLRARCSQ